MKKIFLLILVCYGTNLFAQTKEIKKPEYVIIAKNEIITKEELGELGKQNLIKKMNKGVSKKERDILYKKFGDKIGDKEFIITISLYTKQEKLSREKIKHKYVVEKEDTLNDNLPSIKLGDLAKDFTLKMIDGKKINLSELKGNVILVNFWATWCGPCLMEFYEFPSKIIEPFNNSSFVLLPISRGETEERVKKKMRQLNERGIKFNVGIDPYQTIAGLYNAKEVIPKNVLIDKKGIIRYISDGNSEGSVDILANEIQKLLSE